MTHDEHGQLTIAGQCGKWREQILNFRVGMFVRAAEERADWVDDQQAAIGKRIEQRVEAGEVAIKGERAGDVVR